MAIRAKPKAVRSHREPIVATKGVEVQVGSVNAVTAAEKKKAGGGAKKKGGRPKGSGKVAANGQLSIGNAVTEVQAIAHKVGAWTSLQRS